MARKSRRRGALAAEFALTLPIVLMFFFAAFEFCRFSMLNHTVENAVYEAARRGIVPGATAAEVEQRAEQLLGTLGVNDASIKVVPKSLRAETREITVTITVPFGSNSFAPAKFLAGRSVRRTLTLQREGAP